MWNNLLRKITNFLDPKLEKYRSKPTRANSLTNSSKSQPKFTPRTIEDFIGVLQRTPKSILNDRDRSRIASIMSFDDRTVDDLMVPRSKMIFVHDDEILGPLILDKLYKSGFTNFPVIDRHDKIKGTIHTEALNALEIKKTDRANKYLDRTINYLHATDSLSFAVEEIERTNGSYFLVLDGTGQISGFFTIQLLLDYLLGNSKNP